MKNISESNFQAGEVFAGWQNCICLIMSDESGLSGKMSWIKSVAESCGCEIVARRNQMVFVAAASDVLGLDGIISGSVALDKFKKEIGL
jgi:hypothetical protein